MKTIFNFVFSFLAFFLIAGTARAEQKTLPEGAGVFEFSGHPALAGKTMRVFYNRPSGDISDRPILFVMHGVRRNAETYRNNWVELSEKHGVLVIVPEFSGELFPGARMYNHGNLQTREGQSNPEELWSFSLIDPIFDESVQLSGSNAVHYDLFGHSAGSQFAHRFFIFKQGTKVNRVIASNAGTYTMLDRDVDFPFGLRGVEIDDERLRTLLGRELIVQLGEADTDPDHRSLNVTPLAMKQGTHRFARGLNFFAGAEHFTRALNTDFGWSVRTVPGVGHSNSRMARDIVGYLYGSIE